MGCNLEFASCNDLKKIRYVALSVAVGSEGESSGGPRSPGSLRVEHT